MREQNRNNKRSEIVRFDRFVERKRTCVAFGCWANARLNKLYARELSRNQPILRFNVILQHDWLIEQCLLHIRVFFGGKTKSLCLDLLIHWLIKQITNISSCEHLPNICQGHTKIALCIVELVFRVRSSVYWKSDGHLWAHCTRCTTFRLGLDTVS